MPTLAQYLSLVTPQHRNAPRFMAALSTLLQPFLDQQAFLGTLPSAFDLDEASGVQLDAVGKWIGETRFLKTPLGGVFFSFGDPTLGWGRGRWKGPFDDATGLSRLDDTAFRRLLRAKIAANRWDGTLAGAAAALAYIYDDLLTHVFVQDNQDGTISFNVAGQPLSAVDLALLAGGYIPLKPAGVQLAYINVTSVIGAPLFGFGLDNSSVAGFGKGAWGGTISTVATPASGTGTTGTAAGDGSTDGLAPPFALGSVAAGFGIGVWTTSASPPGSTGGGTVTGGGAAGGSGSAGGTGSTTTPSGGDPGGSGGSSSGTGSGVGTTTGAGTGTGTGPGAGTGTTTPSTPVTTTPVATNLPFGFGNDAATVAGFGAGLWTGLAPVATSTGTASGSGTSSNTGSSSGSTVAGAGTSGGGSSGSGSSTGTGAGTTAPVSDPVAPSGGGQGATTTPTDPATTTTTAPTAPVATTPVTQPAAAPPSFGLGPVNDMLAGFGTGVWTGKAAA